MSSGSAAQGYTAEDFVVGIFKTPRFKRGYAIQRVKVVGGFADKHGIDYMDALQIWRDQMSDPEAYGKLMDQAIKIVLNR